MKFLRECCIHDTVTVFKNFVTVLSRLRVDSFEYLRVPVETGESLQCRVTNHAMESARQT